MKSNAAGNAVLPGKILRSASMPAPTTSTAPTRRPGSMRRSHSWIKQHRKAEPVCGDWLASPFIKHICACRFPMRRLHRGYSFRGACEFIPAFSISPPFKAWSPAQAVSITSGRIFPCTPPLHRKLLKLGEFSFRNDGVGGSNPSCGTSSCNRALV